MKELSIEEKAKAYDEAIDKIKYVMEHGVSPTLNKKDLQDIFPELKESEDEKIRKAIHIYLDWLDGRNKDYQPKGDYSIKDMIAWLEKQGEQKPTDNIEPKFNVGDAIKITGINNGHTGYSILNTEDGYYYNWKLIDKKTAWSEEDEEMFDAIIADIQFTQKAHTHDDNQAVYEREIDWLKSLKQRIEGE